MYETSRRFASIKTVLIGLDIYNYRTKYSTPILDGHYRQEEKAQAYGASHSVPYGC